jgi:hypothetical protein
MSPDTVEAEGEEVNSPPPDPAGETARLIVALSQLASDAGKCIQELRTPDQPWVTAGAGGERQRLHPPVGADRKGQEQPEGCG